MVWFRYRDADGNLPSEIAEDPAKMEDYDYYLDFITGKDRKKINDLIIKLFTTGRQKGRKHKQYTDVLEKLNALKPETKKKGDK